ncbi:hypothetical protein [Flavobacterium sp. '19STA2R22 D10 B1']|uniref:hypothetical protein n=1 Tax=Flavobacterium aerium TaxID=3037261 RepID=UPI00278C1010|nr:hypothetical protein [Flavobacterium sp. '19STA2R22 D10 B1']
MLKSISNLDGIITLNKIQQRSISGGRNGSCAVMMTSGDGEILVMHGTLAEITAAGGNGGGNKWCCKSCNSASWINSCNIC